MGLTWRLARRDLRGVSGGFRLLALAIVLAVAAIAAVGSIADTVRDNARTQAREAIGGDLSFRLFHRQPTPDERAFLEGYGKLSEIAELRPRAVRLDGSRGSLVELKAIDGAYPLYGNLELDPPLPPASALARVNGGFGAVVDADLLAKLDLAVGDHLRLGPLDVAIRARLVAEPDRALRAFALGPRVLISRDALLGSGLAAPGATVYWYSRLRLVAGQDAAAVARSVERRFPHTGWRIVDAADGIPGIERSIALGRALVLAATLAILVIGGVGIAGAVAAHLERKTATIAILKTLGATGGLISRVYLGQLAITAGLATALGLASGAAAPLVLAALADGPLTGITEGSVLQLRALATAAAMGIVTTLIFAILPLARAARTPPSRLLRALVVRPTLRRPGLTYALMGGLGLALAGLVTWTSELPLVSLAVLLAMLVLLALFWAWGRLVLAIANRLRRTLGYAPLCRLALANLGRPGAPTKVTIAALGLGLAALATVVMIERQAARYLASTLPATAPDLVVIDLDPTESAAFERFAGDLPGVVRSRTVPFLHGRITHLAGRPVVDVAVPRDVAWVIRGDRGLSWLAPEDAATIDWVAPANDLPQASLEASIARRLGLELGDRLTIDLLGEPYEVTVGAFHQVDWTRLDLDFPILLAAPEEPPPHRRVGALWLLPEGSAGTLVPALGQRFPAAPVIVVAEVLDALGGILERIASTLRLATAFTLVAAALVLAGGIAAGYERRRREFAVLTVVGVRRRELATSGALELGFLGLAASLPASLVGIVASRAVVTSTVPDAWHLDIAIPLAVIAAATTTLALLGWLVPSARTRWREL